MLWPGAGLPCPCENPLCAGTFYSIRLRQATGFDDERSHLVDPVAGLDVGEHERPVAAHLPGIAVHHAEIRPDGDGFVIADLGSTNGTTVNGATVSARRLEDGDVVGLGATTSFEFRAG